MGQRIKGQNVEILLILNGAPQTNITTVRNFEVTFQTEILSEGYLGETTERKDTIFKGLTGKAEIHFDNQDILKFYAAIVEKSRQRVPGAQVNIKATLNFPNGQRPRVMVPDVEFGPLPVNFGSRGDYGTASLDFAASDGKFLF